MSITVPLEGFGGGSNPLNFKVVGNPQPSNPSENTIWLNTDVPITSWIFSATEPEALTEGMVWFPTGVSSSAEFNALKKNGIQVYPIFAKQCVGGAWVTKTAKIFQGGTWKDWFSGKLYESGNEFVEFTGGWTSDSYSFDHLNYGVTPATKNTNNIYLGGIDNAVSIIGINKPVNLSGCNTICVDWQATGATGGLSIFMGVSSTKAVPKSAPMISFGDAASRRIDRLDVSALNGEYYVYVMAAWAKACKGYVYDVWCE